MKKFIDEYGICDSEEELKQVICGIIKTLSTFAPDEFSSDILNHISPDQDSTTFLQNLAALVPPDYIYSTKYFGLFPAKNSLLESALTLDIELERKFFETSFIKLFFTTFAQEFFCMKYFIAREFIQNSLGEKLKYDFDELFEKLDDASEDELAALIAILNAFEEELRVMSNEKVRDIYLSTVDEFEKSIENYIKQKFSSITQEMFERIFFESHLSNSNCINNLPGLKGFIDPKIEKEWKVKLYKIFRKETSERMGLTHGGSRQREGFSWTKERKVEFYQMVENIPKINRKKDGQKQNIYIWDYVYEQFDSRGVEAKKILKAERSYKAIPTDLLNEAFSKWQKYEESYANVRSEDSPKMFLFRHALQLLNFPDGHFNKSKNKLRKYKKSTLQKYYNEGEKSVGELDNQDET